MTLPPPVQGVSHTWTNAGDYTVTFTAYNVDNPAGVSTNMTVHVEALESPTLSVGSYSNPTFSLDFSSQAGVNYIVEQTTNLLPPIVWSAVTNCIGTGATVQVADVSATNHQRFYRVRVP